MHNDYYVKKIGSNRGARRIYLDGLQVLRAGFSPGDKYEVTIKEGESVTLSINRDGSKVVSRKKSKSGDKIYPVIDLNSNLILSIFEGHDSVRMLIKDGSIVFLPLASEVHIKDRLDRLAEIKNSNHPVMIGSLSHGAGIMCNAIHEGLKEAGLDSNLLFANEIREDLIDHARRKNSAWNDNTRGIAAPMQEIIQDEDLMASLPKLHLLDMSLPCSGASRAGTTKLGLTKAEDHEQVGHLVFAALAIINRVQPSILLLENVVPYSKTASAQILRFQLRDMGYDTHEAVLSGKDWGVLEDRTRWCMVGVTRGVKFDFEDLAPKVKIVKLLGDYLENIPESDPAWSEKTYLFTKQTRDKADGKGFAMQIFNEESDRISTLRKGYQKGGSTDPLIQCKTNAKLFRLLTGDEHARIKQVDTELVAGMSQGEKHRTLGQGVLPPVFKSVGHRIGESIIRYLTDVIEMEPEKAKPRKRLINGVG